MILRDLLTNSHTGRSYLLNRFGSFMVSVERLLCAYQTDKKKTQSNGLRFYYTNQYNKIATRLI